MIGGDDVTIPTLPGTSAMDAAIRAIRMRWPSAVFEDAVNGALFTRYGDLPLRFLREVLIYRDENVRRRWDELGADPSHANTMVHLLSSPSTLTVVVDDLEEAAIRQIVQEIQSALRMDIFTVAAQIRSAA